MDEMQIGLPFPFYCLETFDSTLDLRPLSFVLKHEKFLHNHCD